MSTPETVTVLGKGELGRRIAGWFLDRPDRYKLIQVVPVVPEPGWCSSMTDWGRWFNVPIIETGSFKDASPSDLSVSVGYDRILGALYLSYGRTLNVHNGPLPRYRGVRPIDWALKNHETSHGVTIHLVDTGVDTGPVIARLDYSIYEFDTPETVYTRAVEYGWLLWQQTAPLLDKIRPRSQDESSSLTYTRRDVPRLES